MPIDSITEKREQLHMTETYRGHSLAESSDSFLYNDDRHTIFGTLNATRIPFAKKNNIQFCSSQQLSSKKYCILNR